MIPDLGCYVQHALDVELPPPTPRLPAIEGEPLECEVTLFADGEVEIGVWEVSPGRFPTTREGYNELMIFVSGAGTLTPEGGEPVEVRPGAVVATVDGWRGEFDITETTRKVWVVWGYRR